MNARSSSRAVAGRARVRADRRVAARAEPADERALRRQRALGGAVAQARDRRRRARRRRAPRARARPARLPARARRSRSSRRGRAAAARRRRARSPRSPRPPAAAGACRRCRARPRPRCPRAARAAGRRGARSSCRRARRARSAAIDGGAAERVARVGARRCAGDLEPRCELRRQVLGRVHGEVDRPVGERRLDRVDPAPLVGALAAVAAGAQHDRLHRDRDRGGDQRRLTERERAATGAQPQGRRAPPARDPAPRGVTAACGAARARCRGAAGVGLPGRRVVVARAARRGRATARCCRGCAPLRGCAGESSAHAAGG